jgi:hypothetical protein
MNTFCMKYNLWRCLGLLLCQSLRFRPAGSTAGLLSLTTGICETASEEYASHFNLYVPSTSPHPYHWSTGWKQSLCHKCPPPQMWTLLQFLRQALLYELLAVLAIFVNGFLCILVSWYVGCTIYVVCSIYSV